MEEKDFYELINEFEQCLRNCRYYLPINEKKFLENDIRANKIMITLMMSGHLSDLNFLGLSLNLNHIESTYFLAYYLNDKMDILEETVKEYQKDFPEEINSNHPFIDTQLCCIYYNFCAYEERQQNYKEALDYGLKAFELAQKVCMNVENTYNLRLLIDCSTECAYIYYLMNNKDEAEIFIDNSEELIYRGRVNFPEYDWSESLNQLSDIKRKIED